MTPNYKFWVVKGTEDFAFLSDLRISPQKFSSERSHRLFQSFAPIALKALQALRINLRPRTPPPLQDIEMTLNGRRLNINSKEPNQTK